MCQYEVNGYESSDLAILKKEIEELGLLDLESITMKHHEQEKHFSIFLSKIESGEWQNDMKAVNIINDELFDREWYRSLYPDVMMSGLEPYYHFMKYGKLMGRRGCQIS